MTWRVRVLASPPIAAGFRLAGLAADDVHDGNEMGERLLALSAQPDIGILLAEQSLLDQAPAVVKREIGRRPVPIVLPVPAPKWGAEKSDAEGFILELLRRAIGYRVKLR